MSANDISSVMHDSLNEKLRRPKGHRGPGAMGIRTTVVPPENSHWKPPPEIQETANWLKKQNNR